MTVDRDPKVWLHPDEVRCVGKQCGRNVSCARARAPLPPQYARVEDFGRDVLVWRACPHWLDAAKARPPVTPVTPPPRRHKAIP